MVAPAGEWTQAVLDIHFFHYFTSFYSVTSVNLWQVTQSRVNSGNNAVESGWDKKISYPMRWRVSCDSHTWISIFVFVWYVMCHVCDVCVCQCDVCVCVCDVWCVMCVRCVCQCDVWCVRCVCVMCVMCDVCVCVVCACVRVCVFVW